MVVVVVVSRTMLEMLKLDVSFRLHLWAIDDDDAEVEEKQNGLQGQEREKLANKFGQEREEVVNKLQQV